MKRRITRRPTTAGVEIEVGRPVAWWLPVAVFFVLLAFFARSVLQVLSAWQAGTIALDARLAWDGFLLSGFFLFIGSQTVPVCLSHVISVERGSLTMRSSPAFLRPSRTFPTAKVRDVGVEERSFLGRRGKGWWSVAFTYEGAQVTLLRDIPRDEAFAIAGALIDAVRSPVA